MIAADQNIRKGFVIAQKDVESRLQFFDKRRFEQQCLSFRFCYDELHLAGERDHSRNALRMPSKAGI